MPKRDRSAMDLAHDAIKERIVTLELRPGERLDDFALAGQLNLSRTPVREALFGLSAQGLVTVGNRGGFTVRTLDLIDISQLFEAHLLIARGVARLLAGRVTPRDLDELEAATELVEQAIAEGDPARIAATNADLHRLEVQVAGNEHLRPLALNIHDQGQRLAYLCFGGEGGVDQDLSAHYAKVCTDHRDTLAAARAGDPDAAEAVAARHVHLFRGRVVEFIQANGTDQVTLHDLPMHPLAAPRRGQQP